MINPQPVAGPRSPYSNHTERPSHMPQGPSEPPHNPLNQTPLAPKPSRGKKLRKVIFAIFITIVIAGGVFAAKSILALRDDVLVENDGKKAAILEYEPGGENDFDPAKFTVMGQGRFNMLLLGIDNSSRLTDTIQLLSIDTINQKATITSLPRDFCAYKVCDSNSDKINTVYRDAEQAKVGSGGEAIKNLASDVFGTPITNFAVIDFSGLENLVDTLGGIEVNVEHDLYDDRFPNADGECCSPFSLKAGHHVLDGKTALRYARCRYGTCGNDFGRSKRQQEVIDAIRKKAFSVGVLTNPVKVTSILATLGKSFKTDLDTAQIRKLLSIYSSIPDGTTEGFVIDNGAELGLLITQPGTARMVPKLGPGKFDNIHAWYRSHNPDPLMAKEAPTVSIAAATGTTTKQLETFQEYLEDFGYTVLISTTPVPAKYQTSATAIYEVNAGAKPFARNYLGSHFNLTLLKGSPLSSGSDFEMLYAPGTITSASLHELLSGSASPLD